MSRRHPMSGVPLDVVGLAAGTSGCSEWHLHLPCAKSACPERHSQEVPGPTRKGLGFSLSCRVRLMCGGEMSLHKCFTARAYEDKGLPLPAKRACLSSHAAEFQCSSFFLSLFLRVLSHLALYLRSLTLALPTPLLFYKQLFY